MMYPALGNQGTGVHGNLGHHDDISELDEEGPVASDSTDDLLLIESNDLFLHPDVAVHVNFDQDTSPTDDEMSGDEALFVQFLNSFSSSEGDKLDRDLTNDQHSLDSDMNVYPQNDEEIQYAEYRETRSSQNLKTLYKLKMERQRQKVAVASQIQELRDLELDRFSEKLQNGNGNEKMSYMLPRIVGSYSIEETTEKEIDKQIRHASTPRKSKDGKIQFVEPMKEEEIEENTVRKRSEYEDKLESIEEFGDKDECTGWNLSDEVKRRDKQTEQSHYGAHIQEILRNKDMRNILDGVVGNTEISAKSRRLSLPDRLIVNNMAAKSMAICREIIPEVIVERCESNDNSDENQIETEESNSDSENHPTYNKTDCAAQLADLDHIPFPKLLGNLLKQHKVDKNEKLEGNSTVRLGLPIAISMEKTGVMLLGTVNTSSIINDGFLK